MKNKIFTLIVTSILLISVFLVASNGNEMNFDIEYSPNNTLEDEGTILAPYMIYDVNDLQAMQNNLGANYELANDIDASGTSTWNSGAGFQPVGTSSNPFTGSLDGQGYNVTGLYINRPSTDYVGLFGWTDTGASVTNIAMENVDITGQNDVGGLIGYHSGDTVSYSYTTGTVYGENHGYSFYGLYVGGIMGNNNGGTVSNSYSTASVSGYGSVGGLVGDNSYSTIEKSYAAGPVSGTEDTGGLVGDSSLSDVYDSFWDTQTTGQSTSSGGGTGKTTSEMKTESTFTNAGWDFTNIWWMIEGETYPQLYYDFKTTPSAPQNLQAEADVGQVDLTWSPPLDDGGSEIIDYYIYRDTTSGNLNYYDNVGEDKTSYTDTSLPGGQTYYYQVSAVNSEGEGNKSNEVNATLPESYEDYPIRINNNMEFSEQAAENNWPGDGSESDPYIIEGYDIDGGGYGYCIYIGNTTVQFVVRNNKLHNSSGNSGTYRKNTGLYFYNVTDGLSENNTLLNNYYGAYLYETTDNTVIDNWMENNGGEGIRLDGSLNNFVVNNTVYSNSVDGIFLKDSDYNSVQYNNVSYHTLTGITMSSSDGNDITNNTVSNNGDGIKLNNVCTGNIISDNYVSLNDWNGIYLLYGSDNNTITNNEISSNTESGIYLKQVSNISVKRNFMFGDSILITGNELSHWNTHIIDTNNTVNGKPVYYWKDVVGGTVQSGAGEVILANCTGVIVENQDISDGTVGILMGFAHNNTVVNNTVSGNDWFGTALFNSRDNDIYQNDNGPNNFYGIYVSNSSSNNIFDNTASSNAYDGITLVDSTKNYVTNNTVLSNPRYGLTLDGSDENYISKNTLEHCDDGIRLVSQSNYNKIDDNKISSNNDGIYIESSVGNIFSNNSILNNRDGLRFFLADNNIFLENEVSNNTDYGIYLTYSDNNFIYHNYILGNSVQAFDNGTNRWNETYPSGGNYWSDYTGQDNYSGPGQNEPGSDGIGDTSYTNIDGGAGAQDHYPWVDPTLAGSYQVSVEDITAGESPLVTINDAKDMFNDVIDGDYEVTIEIDNYTVIQNLTFVDGYAEYLCSNMNNSGEYVAYVTIDSTSDSDTFYVHPSSVASSIKISPAEFTIQAGETQTYTAVTIDEYGNEIEDVTDKTNWSIEAGAGGSWDNNSYTSEFKGKWTVNGSYEGMTDEAILTVEAGSVDYVIIAPSEDQIVLAEEELVFAVGAYDGYGNLITDDVSNFTWENAIDGVFNESTLGDYEVKATYNDVNSSITNVTVVQGFDIHLTAGGGADGWNFVSFNLIPLDSSLEVILEDPKYGIAGNYTGVMYYEAESDEWYSHVPGRDGHFNNIDTWDRTMGLWIRLSSNDTLTVIGNPASETNITLYPGWNMVGLPSSEGGNHGLPAEVEKIGYFDETQEYNLAYDYNPETFFFEPGKGYWVYNGADHTVTWNVKELEEFNVINIVSDQDFANQAQTHGWQGDGTESNPYIIENYKINGSGYGNCVEISDTTVHFVLRDNHLHSADIHGVRLENVINGTVSNNLLDSNSESGIYLSSSNNNTMRGNYGSNNKHGIVILVGSDHNTVTDNTVSKNSGTGIAILNSNYNTVTDNTVLDHSDRGIYIDSAESNTIMGNHVSNNGDGIELYRDSCYNYIVNNTVTENNNGIFISYRNNDHNIILKNWISRNTGTGIFSFSIGNNITDNTVKMNEYGIQLGNSESKIINNTISENNVHGIHLGSSDHNIISKNLISRNTRRGIYLDNSIGNNITDNTVEMNEYGIYISQSESKIINNTISENSLYGIYLHYSDNNNITKNIVSENDGYGIYLYYSHHNIICHNEFINNVNQAYDNKDTNLWSKGYPTGGNYWSDWNSPDEYSGPYQDEPGSDGIVDEPYQIDGSGNNMDEYPWTTQNGWESLTVEIREPIRIDSDDDFAGQAAAEGWAGDGTEIDPYIIEDYQIDGNGFGYGIYIGNTTVHFEVRNNYIYDASGNGATYFQNADIHLYNVTNGEVLNNALYQFQQGVTRNYSIYLSNSENIAISNNSVYSNMNGIYMEISEQNTIESNSISYNEDAGIHLTGSSSNIIEGNTVSNNVDYGIYFVGSSSNQIRANSVYLNNFGIYIDSSSDNTLTGNNVSNNGYGIIIYSDSDSNTITNNTVLENSNLGIYIDSNSDYNNIYLNKIINNTDQAYDDGSNNQWDNGDPATGGDGGNYWSDYTGSDRGDGIGDGPYEFNYNQDNYPWVNSDMEITENTSQTSVADFSSIESYLLAVHDDKEMDDGMDGSYSVTILTDKTTVTENQTFSNMESTGNVNDETGRYTLDIPKFT